MVGGDVCIYCFISDPYPVYLMEAKAQRPNSLKVKAKRRAEEVEECVQTYTTFFFLTHTHSRARTHTHTHTPFTSRGAPWLPWNFNVDQLVYLGCEIALNTNTLSHTCTHTQTRTHTRRRSKGVSAVHSSPSAPALG